MKIELYVDCETDDFDVAYTGMADDLMAAGVARAETLARGRPGRTRRDHYGEKCKVTYYTRQVRLGYERLPLAKVRRMPGVTPTLVQAAHDERDERFECWRREYGCDYSSSQPQNQSVRRWGSYGSIRPVRRRGLRHEQEKPTNEAADLLQAPR